MRRRALALALCAVLCLLGACGAPHYAAPVYANYAREGAIEAGEAEHLALEGNVVRNFDYEHAFFGYVVETNAGEWLVCFGLTALTSEALVLGRFRAGDTVSLHCTYKGYSEQAGLPVVTLENKNDVMRNMVTGASYRAEDFDAEYQQKLAESASTPEWLGGDAPESDDASDGSSHLLGYPYI